MEFDCGQRGHLTITFYKQCEEIDFEANKSTITGQLRFTFNKQNFDLNFEYPDQETLQKSLTVKVLEECLPNDNRSINFNRTSHGILSLIHNENKYNSSVSDSDLHKSQLNKGFHAHLGCVVNYLKGNIAKKGGLVF